MGLVASQARLLMLHERKSDIEFRMQSISQQLQMMLAASSRLGEAESRIINQFTGSDQSAQAQFMMIEKQFEIQKTRIHNKEKDLDRQMTVLETQLKAVTTEIESVKGMLDKNVEAAFKYFG